MLAKPVLVSDGIAIAELVRALGCGKIVPYGNRAAIQKALEDLLLSPSECEILGARGRAAFERGYNWGTMATRLLEAYGSLGIQNR